MKFEKHQQAQLTEYIQRWWSQTDQALDVKRHEAPRTSSQRALIHSIISDLAKHSGAGAEWMKQSLLKRDCEGIFPHWPTKIESNRHGDRVVMPKSEADLKKAEESELIERLYALGGEWGMSWEAV
jgi:hypothetical protein